MERRFATRLEELLDDAIVDPAVLRDMLPRLERFVQPFATLLATPEQGVHLQEYVSGLVSNVKRKNVESIAYHHDQDSQALQKFIGQIPWDHQPHVTDTPLTEFARVSKAAHRIEECLKRGKSEAGWLTMKFAPG